MPQEITKETEQTNEDVSGLEPPFHQESKEYERDDEYYSPDDELEQYWEDDQTKMSDAGDFESGDEDDKYWDPRRDVWEPKDYDDGIVEERGEIDEEVPWIETEAGEEAVEAMEFRKMEEEWQMEDAFQAMEAESRVKAERQMEVEVERMEEEQTNISRSIPIPKYTPPFRIDREVVRAVTKNDDVAVNARIDMAPKRQPREWIGLFGKIFFWVFLIAYPMVYWIWLEFTKPQPPTTIEEQVPCAVHCTRGQACGDSCISWNLACHQPPGRACN